jgi:outer membrane protein assembly factor BamB
MRTLFPLILLTLLSLAQTSLFAQEGTQKWAFDTDGQVVAAPAIGDDGIIYVSSNDDHLYAIQPDGTQKWKFDTGSDAIEATMIGDDGTIYIGTRVGEVIALNPDGTVKWTRDHLCLDRRFYQSHNLCHSSGWK